MPYVKRYAPSLKTTPFCRWGNRDLERLNEHDTASIQGLFFFSGAPTSPRTRMASAYLLEFLSMRIKFWRTADVWLPGEDKAEKQTLWTFLPMFEHQCSGNRPVTGEQAFKTNLHCEFSAFSKQRKAGPSTDVYIWQHLLVKLKNSRDWSRITNYKAPSSSQHDTHAELTVIMLW